MATTRREMIKASAAATAAAVAGIPLTGQGANLVTDSAYTQLK